MALSAVSELSRLEDLEQQLQANVSVSLLAQIERELLRLRRRLSVAEWKGFCGTFRGRPLYQLLRAGTRSTFDEQIPNGIAAESFPARHSTEISPHHTIGAWEYSLPVSRSVRSRAAYFRQEIAETLRTAVQPRILILGGGSLVEAEDALHSGHLHHAQFVALQGEHDRLQRLRYACPLQLVKGNWGDLSALSADLGLFDLIYAPSWLDATNDVQAANWLDAAVELLRGCGRLLAANFTPGSRDSGWVEACWNLHPHYRSAEQLARLAAGLKNPGIRGHTVFPDESSASAFVEIHSI